MQTRLPRLAATAVLAAGLLAARASAQTLAGRTPIDSLPATIAQPGSYSLTGNLAGVAGQDGITITAGDVTIDLGGFTLAGVPGSGDGIRVAGGAGRVTVRNGRVRGWGGHGVNLQLAPGSAVEGVEAESNASSGVRVGAYAVVRDCRATQNLVGIHVEGDSLVLDSLARDNAAAGIELTGGSSLALGNLCEANQVGLVVLDSAGHLLAENACNENRSHGISASTAALVLRNQCSRNGLATPDGAGIELRGGASFALENHVAFNDVGITAFSSGDEVVVRNTAHQNAANYAPMSGNDFAPAAGSVSSAGPWANVSH